MLVHIKDIVKEAQKGKYAIGAFNVHNLESILAVARAAVKSKSPAIIQVSEGTIQYMGLKPITHLVSTVAKNIALNVPIALHLDHGKSLDYIFECINVGFSSVHIDASDKPFDENIAITKQAVEIARKKKVWVQGEIGAIYGGHGKKGEKIGKIPLADPQEVINFVKETKIDTISAAVGTAHGVYKDEKIDFKLLKKIIKRIKIPFVLHGASGIADRQIKKGIKMGIDIINIGSDIKIAFSRTLIKNCAKNKKETDPRKLMTPSIEAVEEVVNAKMKLFGSKNMVKISELES